MTIQRLIAVMLIPAQCCPDKSGKCDQATAEWLTLLRFICHNWKIHIVLFIGLVASLSHGCFYLLWPSMWEATPFGFEYVMNHEPISLFSWTRRMAVSDFVLLLAVDQILGTCFIYLMLKERANQSHWLDMILLCFRKNNLEFLLITSGLSLDTLGLINLANHGCRKTNHFRL